MPKVIKGKVLLCSYGKKNFRAIQQLGDHALFNRYEAIENIVNKNIDEKFRHFLAQPIVEDDIFSWYIGYYNETPQRLSDLQGEERQKYEQIKNETVDHYKSVADSFKQAGKSDEYECFSKAMKFISDDVIYCFDNKVVLGIWGMHLKENVRDSFDGVVTKKDPPKGSKPPKEIEIEPETVEPEPPSINPFAVRFNAGENGNINGISEYTKYGGDIISASEVPQVMPKEGYQFTGWDRNPIDCSISGDTEFTAQYRQVETPPVVPPNRRTPWWRRFLNWLKGLWRGFSGRGCLKWLLWLLLILLLLWLLRNCTGCSNLLGGRRPNPIPTPIQDRPWVDDNPHNGGGGIFDPGNPYTPVPTPPEFNDVLPPQQGVLPPIESNPDIIPGNPYVFGNRLNILMDNDDKTIFDFVRYFRERLPEFEIIYYSDVVKRVQIRVPREKRERLREEIPAKFAPTFDLFVFDEALFESNFTPQDPAFRDNDKAWYLHAVRAPQAWAISRGSPNITIAIVDDGFDLRHPELRDRVVMPFNVWTHSSNVFPRPSSHGTHVAGTALGASNNRGLLGIAHNSAFMPIQVADERGFMTTTSVLDGILFALFQGADVINVSLGISFSGLDRYPEERQRQMMRYRFREEERLWNRVSEIADRHNAVIVVAAGNDNVLAGIDPLHRPENIITVSAVDRQYQPFSRAGFSNFGEHSTISAPGVRIYSSVGRNDFAFMDGTSMAAPIVAGGIALMRSLDNSLTTRQIICILQNTGLPTSGNIGRLIQLDRALEMILSGAAADCTEPLAPDLTPPVPNVPDSPSRPDAPPPPDVPPPPSDASPPSDALPPPDNRLDELQRRREELQRQLDDIDRQLRELMGQ